MILTAELLNAKKKLKKWKKKRVTAFIKEDKEMLEHVNKTIERWEHTIRYILQTQKENK